MKTHIITFLLLLIFSTSYGQLTGCFKKSKGKHGSSSLIFHPEMTYSHKIMSTGHLSIISYEKGNYTMKGDTVIFSVTAYGVDENALQPQLDRLERKGILKGNRVILLNAKGETFEKLRKTKCR